MGSKIPSQMKIRAESLSRRDFAARTIVAIGVLILSVVGTSSLALADGAAASPARRRQQGTPRRVSRASDHRRERTWICRDLLVRPVRAGSNAAVQHVLTDPEFAKTFLAPNFYDPFLGSPEEFAQTIRSDTEKWGQVIKDAKLSAEE